MEVVLEPNSEVTKDYTKISIQSSESVVKETGYVVEGQSTLVIGNDGKESDAVVVETDSAGVDELSEKKPAQVEAIKPIDILKHRMEDISNPIDRLLCDMNFYFAEKLYQRLNCNLYNVRSVISQQDEDRQFFAQIFSQMKETNTFSPDKLNLTIRQSRGIASVLGMAIGDALGASTQFEDFNKKGLGIIKEGFDDIYTGILQGKIQARSNKVAVWTDDASMGLCLADSLLLNDYQFNPKHIRYLFILWLKHGLNNGGRDHSIGLGGNISISMNEFMFKQEEYTQPGERFNNGNGSLMRLAPVPVAFIDEIEKGILYSGLQSLTTHNGLEAQQCCRLMANILIELINRPEGADGKALILQVCNKFESPVQSVVALARGEQQSEQLYKKSCQATKKFKKFNKKVTDRNWNWRDETHTYSFCRRKQQPGYIGSYCMDALAMALHTVWFSSSFKEVVIRNADMGGDCDTVGSIAGQIAGALYGIDADLLKLYSDMNDFKSDRFDVFLKAYKLVNRKKI